MRSCRKKNCRGNADKNGHELLQMLVDDSFRTILRLSSYFFHIFSPSIWSYEFKHTISAISAIDSWSSCIRWDDFGNAIPTDNGWCSISSSIACSVISTTYKIVGKSNISMVFLYSSYKAFPEKHSWSVLNSGETFVKMRNVEKERHRFIHDCSKNVSCFP